MAENYIMYDGAGQIVRGTGGTITVQMPIIQEQQIIDYRLATANCVSMGMALNVPEEEMNEFVQTVRHAIMTGNYDGLTLYRLATEVAFSIAKRRPENQEDYHA